MERNLLIMAKRPVPGAVKTRLQPEVTPFQSAEIARAMLSDVIREVSSFPGSVTIGFSPSDAEEYFQDLTNGRFSLARQIGNDLGSRMASIFGAVAGPAVMIGTDTPGIRVTEIEEAFEELESADLVLGPSMDGGYYLIGSTQFRPEVFRGVDWSTEKTLDQTIRNAESIGFEVSLLKQRADIDCFKDLMEYASKLRSDTKSELADWIRKSPQLFRT